MAGKLKFPLLLLVIFLMLYFFTFKMYIYILLCVIVRITYGVKTKTTTLELPYFLDGVKEDLNCTEIVPIESKKEVMFFIHGWPDSKEVWKEQVKFFSKNYHCVTIDLLWYGDYVPGMTKWGFTYEETADIISNTIRRSLKKTGQKKAILVIHDWGSLLGTLIERKVPDLISKMIVLDVFFENFDGGVKAELIYMILYQN